MTLRTRGLLAKLGGLLPHFVHERKRLVAASGLALLAVASGVSAAAVKMDGLPDNAAFRIGDQIITEAQLQGRMKILKALYGIQQPSGEKVADSFRRDSAKAIATSMIIDNAARQRNIPVSDRFARDRLSKMIEEGLGGDRSKFVDLLGEVGASEQDVIEEIKRQERTSRLARMVTDDVPEVTATDVRRAFRERRKEMFTPAERHLRNIVVATRSDAEKILEHARADTDFNRLAKEQSLDESTRDKGGDLGFVTREQLASGYAKIAFETPVGSFFGPVKTAYGWNVGQVLDRQSATPLKLDDIKTELRDSLSRERHYKAWKNWLSAEIERADVEYADKFRPPRQE